MINLIDISSRAENIILKCKYLQGKDIRSKKKTDLHYFIKI